MKYSVFIFHPNIMHQACLGVISRNNLTLMKEFYVISTFPTSNYAISFLFLNLLMLGLVANSLYQLDNKY